MDGVVSLRVKSFNDLTRDSFTIRWTEVSSLADPHFIYILIYYSGSSKCANALEHLNLGYHDLCNPHNRRNWKVQDVNYWKLLNLRDAFVASTLVTKCQEIMIKISYLTQTTPYARCGHWAAQNILILTILVIVIGFNGSGCLVYLSGWQKNIQKCILVKFYLVFDYVIRYIIDWC